MKNIIVISALTGLLMVSGFLATGTEFFGAVYSLQPGCARETSRAWEHMVISRITASQNEAISLPPPWSRGLKRMQHWRKRQQSLGLHDPSNGHDL